MTRKAIARLAGFSAGAAMVLGVAGPVSAQTVAELQAQIAALMAQLASLSGGSSAGAAITSDLTVGSTGAQVVALQNALEAQGHLMMPAGVAKGYFGALTKAAVAKWQAANGLPATGYFGPLSRAKFNAGSTVGGGTTTGGTVGAGSTGVITTPGAEGDITVTAAPVSNSTVYEGTDMATLLAFKVEASGSDMAVQRVRVDLGTTNTFYRDILDRIYLVDDAGRTLAQADLNTSTVVRNANDEYEITLTGFSSVVARGASRVYSIKGDVSDSIDSADIDTETYTITLSENGVRAVDGAGIDAFDPTNDTDVTKTLTFSASLAESASLVVSTGMTPAPREVIASAGAQENEADKVVLLVFDIRAEKDAIRITDLNNFVVTAAGSAPTPATASTTYLYAGNGTSGQLLGTDAAASSDVDFDNISYTIPANTTRTFTLAADIRGAVSSTTVSASFTGNTTNVVGESSLGDTVSTVSGSASGNTVVVKKVGPVFTLLSAPTVSKTAAAFAGATTTAQATFKVRMTAVGGDIEFGGSASTTYAIADQDNTVVLVPGGLTSSVVAYLNGTITHPLVASSTTVTIPSVGVVNLSSLNSYRLSEGNSIDLTIDFVLPGKTSAGADISSGAYTFELQKLNWVSSYTGRDSSTFMASSTDWRTPAVTLP